MLVCSHTPGHNKMTHIRAELLGPNDAALTALHKVSNGHSLEGCSNVCSDILHPAHQNSQRGQFDKAAAFRLLSGLCKRD